MDDFISRVYQVIPPLQEGELAEGIVTKIEENGVIVKISHGVYGRVSKDEITNSQIKNLYGYFHKGQPVRARILKIQEGPIRYILSIRQMPIYDRIMYRDIQKDNYNENNEDISVILDNYPQWLAINVLKKGE